ncbi:polyprenyl diphosphate synthase [uncultured Eubacterium sp.]|uniref:polyprenyl diphosphate synthase n=1 Tax=uncultured Eubacterium sp. TaxID=165185 RepID=UPI0025F12823|nr:polyprenyl diphosphate synthase [uncultured Eubacterium sp.]
MALFSKKESNAVVERPQFEILPEHIGIIMDGNGRWAKKRGLPRTAGHKQGAETFRTISKECGRLGIKHATFYAFSTENWKRPKEEVDAIMRLFKQYLLEAKEDITAAENNKLRFIGLKDGIPDDILTLMEEAEEDTKNNTGCDIALAVNYGGREEIVNAVNKLIADGKTEITEDDISQNIYTVPDCDLIIRPSGEQRLSNFLLWQAAYSEFWYSDVMWPDFSVQDLYKALSDFENRNRRFGG